MYQQQQEVLDSICTSQCQSTLTTARATIASGCKGTNDTFDAADGMIYPGQKRHFMNPDCANRGQATFVIDHYIHAYDLGCRRDP